MLTAAKVAFSFCIIFGVFEETFPWTIDLPQVRKYFFEKSLKDKEPDQNGRIVYDNIDTYSPHFDYEKYRENYNDEYEYEGYMEQKVHDAVRNGSAYLEGLRRAIENYTRRLEDCRRMNFSVNILQLQANVLNLTNPTTLAALANPSTFNASNFMNLPANFTQNFPANFTRVMNTNFTEFMRMSNNSTVFNVNDSLRECMRADQASEHVRRLAQLAIWAASELQDKLYEDKYSKHNEDHDGTLILKLAWFLDRLAHLTGYDPQPHQFVEPKIAPPSTPAPMMQSLVPGLVSTEDLQRLLTCLQTNSSTPAPDRCSFASRSASDNPVSFMNRNYPGPPSYNTDLLPSGSDNHEYTFTDQDYAEENMPLPLPPKLTAVKATAVKTKRKRSVQEDPLLELIKYIAKFKVWIGSNLETKDASGEIENSLKRSKRFLVKKSKHLKNENPLLDISDVVKHKIGVHYNKDKDQVRRLKEFFEKLNVKRPSKGKLKLFKKIKRSVGYMRKYQPRVPTDPQGDISYYVKNKKGTNYDYNAAQALLVRAGLEQVFQTGNIEVVRRYGSNYNPAVRDQIIEGGLRSSADV